MTTQLNPLTHPDHHEEHAGERHFSWLAWFSSPWVTSLFLMLVGLAVRLLNVQEKSLWSDELCTIASALGNSLDPLAQIGFDPDHPVSAQAYLEKATTSHGLFNWEATAEILKKNIHPPLFFWMMNPVIETFGTSAAVLRILAVGFSALCIPALFVFGRHLGGYWVGLIAAFLFLTSGFQIDHAQDARQYSWVTLLSIGASLSFIKALNTHKMPQAILYWGMWGLASLLGLYSQYFYGVFWFLQIAYGIVFAPRTSARLALLGTSMAVIAGISPWLSVFKEQLVFMKAQGHYTDGLWKPIQLPEIIWRRIGEYVYLKSVAGKWMMLGIVVTLVLVFQSRIRLAFQNLKSLFSPRSGEQSGLNQKAPLIQLNFNLLNFKSGLASGKTFLGSGWGWIIVWLVGLFAAQIALDVLKDSHTLTIRRYTLLAAPPIYLFLALGLQRLWLASQQPALSNAKRYAVKTVVTAALSLCIWNAWETVNGDNYTSDDFKGAAYYINRLFLDPEHPHQLIHDLPDSHLNRVKHPLVLVHKSGAMAVGLSYYLTPETPMMGIPTPEKLPQRDWTESALVLAITHAGNVEKTMIHEQLLRIGYQLSESKTVPGIKLFVYMKPQPEGK
jgi:uncharacterized membrane protein